MIRKIIKINNALCNGCGLCAKACHENAIGMVDGKAKLLRDDYCDGLGDCLPACPTGAITFENREALDYDEAAVKAAQAKAKSDASNHGKPLPCGCPGSESRVLREESNHDEPLPCGCPGSESRVLKSTGNGVQASKYDNLCHADAVRSELKQWPVQIKLVPVSASYFSGANLLISADCAAYAYADFHRKFMRGKITLMGCPKLDGVQYAEKLTQILRQNDIKSLTLVRMEVPCCGGLEHAAVEALQNCGKMIPWRVVTLSTSGELLDE